MVVLFEITLYAIIGAGTITTISWTSRCVVFGVLNILFGLITYLIFPYTEELDRWLEFCGRLLVLFVCTSQPYLADVKPNATGNDNAGLYTPFANLQTILTELENGIDIYFVIDAVLVFGLLFYMLFIFERLGGFGALDRFIHSFRYAFHDHVMNFIISKLDERVFGLENTFSGTSGFLCFLGYDCICGSRTSSNLNVSLFFISVFC